MQIQLTTLNGMGETILLPPEIAFDDGNIIKDYPGIEIPGKHGQLPYDELERLESRTLRASGTFKGISKEDADTLYHKYAGMLLGQKDVLLRRYVGAERYIKVKVSRIDHNYFRGHFGGVVFSMTFMFVADDPFWYSNETTIEYYATPNSYPTRVELESPDPRINLQFGNYNTTTGAKISDVSTWVTEIVGEYNNIRTLTVGDGFEFDCYGGFALNTYETSSRKFKVWIDNVLQGEINPTGSSYGITYIKDLITGVKHHVKIVATTSYGLIANYIDLAPSNINATAIFGTAECYPKIELSPADTIVRHNVLGKTVGDTTHPITIRYGVATSLSNILPTSGVEITDYASRRFLNGTAPFHQSTTAGEFPYYLIEINTLATKSGIPSTWTAAMVQQSLRYLALRFWGYGEGANAGVTEYGAEMTYRISTGWVTSAEMTNNSSTSSLIQRISDIAAGNTPSVYIDSNGKAYVLVKPKYASNGIISSRIYLNYCDFELRYSCAVVGANVLINRAVNLIPPFTSTDWTLRGNYLITDDYTLELSSVGTTYDIQSITIPVTPYKQYYISAQQVKRLLVYQGNTISGTYVNMTAGGVFTAETNYITLRLDNSAVGGLFVFKNLVMVQTNTPVAFSPKILYSVGFSEQQTLTPLQRIKIDSGNQFNAISKDNTKLYDVVNDEFISKGIKFEPGFNHLQTSNTGSVMKVSIKYNPKWY